MLMKLLAAAILLPTTASAAVPEPSAPPPAADLKIEGISEPVFVKLFELARAPATQNKAAAEALRDAIRADGKVDAAEADLLNEMAAPNVRTITVSPPSTRYQRFPAFPVFGDARIVLRQTLRPLVALRTALDGGQPGWNLLVDAYSRDESGKADALEVLTERLTEDATASNIANRYKPLRDRITAYYTFTSSRKSAEGRQLLREAARAADLATADKLPDFIYNWVKPAA